MSYNRTRSKVIENSFFFLMLDSSTTFFLGILLFSEGYPEIKLFVGMVNVSFIIVNQQKG